MCVYIRVSYICVDAFYSGGFIKLRISRYAFTCHIALLVIGYSNQLCDMKMEFIVFVVLQYHLPPQTFCKTTHTINVFILKHIGAKLQA